MAVIPLSKGYFATVDDSDAEFISQWKWSTYGGGERRPYAGRRQRQADGSYKLVLMHRAINQTPDGLVTDHIDGDSLNNRRANLRSATVLQNQMNKSPNRGGSSPLKGVWRDGGARNRKPWRAGIRIDGRMKYLGRFETQEEGAEAYAEAARIHFGDFARTTHGASQ